MTVERTIAIKASDYTMSRYYNLPWEQRRVQPLVALFNFDEQLWKSLERGRRLRRKRVPWLPKKQLKRLDLLDFDNARPPQDCMGTF